MDTSSTYRTVEAELMNTTTHRAPSVTCASPDEALLQGLCIEPLAGLLQRCKEAPQVLSPDHQHAVILVIYLYRQQRLRAEQQQLASFTKRHGSHDA